ncbi:MAG: hypothetical protein WD007_02440 [Nitriliruptoraceae bacterium]
MMLGGVAVDAKWVARPVGLRDVAGELLVRDVRIVLERSRRIDDVHVVAAFIASQCHRQFGSPHRWIEQRREVHMIRNPARMEVRLVSWFDEVTFCEAVLGVVVERPCDMIAVVEGDRDVCDSCAVTPACGGVAGRIQSRASLRN